MLRRCHKLWVRRAGCGRAKASHSLIRRSAWSGAGPAPGRGRGRRRADREGVKGDSGVTSTRRAHRRPPHPGRGRVRRFTALSAPCWPSDFAAVGWWSVGSARCSEALLCAPPPAGPTPTPTRAPSARRSGHRSVPRPGADQNRHLCTCRPCATSPGPSPWWSPRSTSDVHRWSARLQTSLVGWCHVP